MNCSLKYIKPFHICKILRSIIIQLAAQMPCYKKYWLKPLHYCNISYSMKGFLFLALLIFSTANAQQTAGNYQFKKNIFLVSTPISASVLGFSLYKQAHIKNTTQPEILLLNRQQINAFDRIATHQWQPNTAKASDILALSTTLLPLLFLTHEHSKKDFFKIANVSFQSFLLSQALCNSVKLTKINRPFLYNEKVPMAEKLNKENNLSFFSGHTTWASSMCFSTAFAFQTYNPKTKATPYIFAAAATLPAIQAFMRVRAGKHYPSDVIVGYLVGLGSSFLMHRLHL